MDLRNANGIQLRSFTLQPYRSFFRKFPLEVEKCIIWSSIQLLPNQVSTELFHTFDDIDSPESCAKLHKNPSETLGSDPI